MTDPRFEELLGFGSEAVIGRSIRFMMGPHSDVVQIDSAIKATACAKTTTSFHAALYSGDGECKRLAVTCSPFYQSNGELIGCGLAFEPSHALSVSAALEVSRNAKMLVSADSSHTVQAVNEEFTRVFGIDKCEIAGRSLRMIHGPRTNRATWQSLLQAACAGRSSEGVIVACSRTCQESEYLARVFPVVDDASRIGSLVIYFYPQPVNTFECDWVGSEAPSYFHTLGCRDTSPAHRDDLSEDLPSTDGGAHTPYGCPAPRLSQRPVGVPLPAGVPSPIKLATPSRLKVVPRRRLARATSPPAIAASAVEITLGLLGNLSDVSIAAAASRIGISTSALKKACRRLGVSRWPYRRESRTAPPASSCIPSAPRDFDDSYVRMLHRKYGTRKTPSASVARPPASTRAPEQEVSAAPSCMCSAAAQSAVAEAAASASFVDETAASASFVDEGAMTMAFDSQDDDTMPSFEQGSTPTHDTTHLGTPLPVRERWWEMALDSGMSCAAEDLVGWPVAEGRL